MFRNTLSFVVRFAVVAVALGASGIALADDNGMSPLTGESYAYFHGLDYIPGGFNVAATHSSQAAGEASAQPAAAQPQPERPIMLARQAPSHRSIMAPRIFNDNTGA